MEKVKKNSNKLLIGRIKSKLSGGVLAGVIQLPSDIHHLVYEALPHLLANICLV